MPLSNVGDEVWCNRDLELANESIFREISVVCCVTRVGEFNEIVKRSFSCSIEYCKKQILASDLVYYSSRC